MESTVDPETGETTPVQYTDRRGDDAEIALNPHGGQLTQPVIQYDVPMPELVQWAFGVPSTLEVVMEVTAPGGMKHIDESKGFKLDLDVSRVLRDATITHAYTAVSSSYLQRIVVFIAGLLYNKGPKLSLGVRWQHNITQDAVADTSSDMLYEMSAEMVPTHLGNRVLTEQALDDLLYQESRDYLAGKTNRRPGHLTYSWAPQEPGLADYDWPEP